jgi:hypothetical protein
MLSWAPYLLNLFLDDCRDVQDLGTKFHYSWLLILIALIGWREPQYTYFCERTSHCHAMWYTSLGSTLDPKIKSTNASTFVRYYNELQESIANSWRITPEVVVQYRDIVNFKATRHTVWIQARRDPEKEWLQLRYCVKEEDVEMEIRDWQDDWRIPVLTQEMPTGMETDAGKVQTPVGDKVALKKPKPSQNLDTTKEGGCAKERYPGRTKGHYPSTKRTRKRGCDNTRNLIDCHPIGTRPDQEAHHPHWGCMQKGQGTQAATRIYNHRGRC